MPKRLSLAYLERMRERYKNASKKLKSAILSEFCINSTYSRKHAARILKGRTEPRRVRPGPKPKYGPEVTHHLRVVWEAMGRICSKKVKAALPLWLGFYKDANQETKAQLLRMSASTIDSRLGPFRSPKQEGKATTRGLKAMMGRIPLKLLDEEVEEPGFMEVDTVAHCGDNIAGEYAHSLTMTDLCSCWTENAAVWTKDSGQVLKQIQRIESRLPFRLKGCAADNGSEFMNYGLMNYFSKRDAPIEFVRRRPYKKNDNAHVEQKNFTHVRQLFGYERFEEFELTVFMNEIYELYWNPLWNYFTPSMKLKSKERHGSKVKKQYDVPKTPCQRLLEMDCVPQKVKQQLKFNMRYKNPLFLEEGTRKEAQDFLPSGRRAQEKKVNDRIVTHYSLEPFIHESIWISFRFVRLDFSRQLKLHFIEKCWLVQPVNVVGLEVVVRCGS